MRKKILFVFVLMLLIASLSAIHVEVGTGTESTNYIPAYGLYNYGWSRAIYLQSELMNEMEINKVSYNVNNSPSNYTMTNQSIYLKHTTDSFITSTDYVEPSAGNGYELVYSGSITYNGAGWFDIILDTTFEYNGTDNLEIFFKNNHGQWASGYPNFVATSATPQRASYKNRDVSYPDIAGTLSDKYPNMRFHFIAENQPYVATLTAPTNGSYDVAIPVELEWTNGDDTDWVKIYLSDNYQHVSTMNASALVADEYTQESYTADDLNPLTNYHWRIVAGNDISEYIIPSQVWSFTTAAEDGSILIGTGTEENISLPMEPYWAYSLSQTIYNQEWINVDDQRIEQISYYFNGHSAWVEDVQIFMAHTTLNTFETTTSWVLEDDLMLVYDGQIETTAQEGWITLPLSVPFNYNNTDNLLVAFAANTPGHASSNDDFVGSVVDGNKSIYFRSDSINSDFISPSTGILSNKIPNTLLTMGDIPTTAELMVFPDSHVWDETIINTNAISKTFAMRNTGVGALTVNSVTLNDDSHFILTDTNSYPLSLTIDPVQFAVNFHPTAVGDWATTITINDSENGDTVIPLSGTGYDAMIHEFPYFAGFEDLANDELPQDWASVISSTNALAAVGSNSSNAYEGSRSLRFYNSSDTNPTLIAITPPVNELSARRVRFMAKGQYAGLTLTIGTAMSNTGDVQFTPLETITLTADYEQYLYGLVDAADDAQFIALKYGGTGDTYRSIYVDNFFIETIPEGAAIVITEDTLDFGDVYLNRTGAARLNVENWGIEPLEIDFSQTGTEFNFIPEELTIESSNNGFVMVQLTPEAEGAYSGSFTVNSNDPNLPEVTINAIANILPPLPEGVVVIGNGTTINQGLPLEPWNRHSYSQSIYYAGEIGLSNQRVEKISWHYNGNSAWGPDELKIYMGLTDEVEFASNTSWISTSEMQEVYDGTITVPSTDGLVEIILDVPFNYDNTRNLVVGVFHSHTTWHSSNDEFYCTTTDATRSILYQNDSTIPDPNAPPAANNMRNSYPNVRFQFGEIPTGVAIRVSPDSLDFGDVYLNRTRRATLNIRNLGTATLEANLTQTGTELTFTPDEVSVEPFESADVSVEYTPEAEGAYSGSFVVNSNDLVNPAITVPTLAYVLPALPEGLVVIGDGTLIDQGLPMEPWFKHSYAQTIYYADEINIADQRIETVSWHYNGGNAWGPDELKIYMGLTDETSFATTTSWIDVDDMMEVYDGTITVPASDGLVEIMLDIPFAYDDTQNLVVAVFHSADPCHSNSDDFYCTSSVETRSLVYRSDSTIPNPASPPAASYLRNSYPNVRLQLNPAPEGPALRVTPNPIDFGEFYLNRTGIATLNILNLGIADLEAEFTQTGTQFSFTPDEVTVAPYETVQVTVGLTADAEGAYTGSFTVTSNDPLNPELTVNAVGQVLPALPEGLVIIGDGTMINQGLPFEPFYRHSYSQSIYHASEIGISDQRIEEISWHYNGNSAWGPDEFKVYMGLTSEAGFATNTSWIDVNEMMEVYDGTITVPATDGLITIELDIPFNYNTSQNLVVGVFHSAPSWHSSSDEFFCTATSETRSILYYNDSTIPEPTAPPTANYMRSAYPNIRLQFGAVPDTAELTVYPGNVVYEMVAVGASSSEKTFTMRSIGLQDVLIAEAPVIAGVDADQYTITTDNNSYPLVLPFGQMATVGVSFSPTSEGSKSAMLEITGTESRNLSMRATVRSAGNRSREAYTANLNGYGYADDGNDEPTGATVLTLPVNGDTYAIMPAGDIDWYKIPAMGIGDTLMTRVENAGGSNVGAKIWLYGPVTNPANIQSGAYIADGTDLEIVLPASGDYFMRVAKSTVTPSGVNPPLERKGPNAESERDVRSDTGLYNLYADARYNYAYNAPLNLEASNQDGFVALSWVEPPYERYLIGYHVYRNGAVITETMIPIGTDTYEDATVVVGTEYNYHVIGMYEDPDGFSLPSNTVTITYFNIGEPLWGDDFEDHPDFALDLPNWIQYDVDGGDTYSISNVEFENAGEPMSYIVFNPSSTVPPITDMEPQSGDKFLASFASSEGQNDDWIITPRITIGTTTVVSFYARSYTSDYGLEKFKVRMSLGGDQVEDFTYTLHQGLTHEEPPTEWTHYVYNVSQLVGNTARFAIQCVSENAFILMIDDFRIDSTDDGVDNEDVEVIPQVNALSQNYPNPFNPETSISFSIKDAGSVNLDIYNIRGQKVKTLLNEHREAGKHNIIWNGTDDNGKNVSSGVYFYKLRNGKFSSTKKMILMK